VRVTILEQIAFHNRNVGKCATTIDQAAHLYLSPVPPMRKENEVRDDKTGILEYCIIKFITARSAAIGPDWTFAPTLSGKERDREVQ